MASPVAQRPTSYPVLFCLVGEPAVPGSMTVAADQVLLEGGAASRPTTLRLNFAELREVRIGRAPAERLNGYSVLVLASTGGPDVCVAPLGPGVLHEVEDLIAGLTGPSPAGGDRIAVVIPLKPDMQARVRALVREGPPLDPAELGLREHIVALRGNEVLFVFAGSDVWRKIERAASRPALWRAGLAWRTCIAGAPRLTAEPALDGSEVLYSWRTDYH